MAHISQTASRVQRPSVLLRSTRYERRHGAAHPSERVIRATTNSLELGGGSLLEERLSLHALSFSLGARRVSRVRARVRLRVPKKHGNPI